MAARIVGLLGVVCLVCLFGWCAWAEPPVIVETVPVKNDLDVDPGLGEITVRFDQSMRVGSHSWVGGGELFPELTGRPEWVDDRTAVLRVKLEAGRDYSVGINSVSNRNFRSAAGESVEPYRLTFRTAGGDVEVVRLTREQNEAAIEALRRAVDEEYS